MIHLVICDDHPEHNATMRLMVQRALDTCDVKAEFACVTTSAEDVIAYARQATTPTLYFLDICLDEEHLDVPHGIDLAHRIFDLDASACIIYVSAYQQFSFDCVQSHAFDFLLKPFNEAQLTACLHAALRRMEAVRSRPTLSVKIGSRMVTLFQDEILYFEKQREYVIAHEATQTTTWRENFDSLIARLDHNHFLMVHKSYCVNLDHVREFNFPLDTLEMTNGASIPISRRRKAAVRDHATGGLHA